MTVPMLCSDFAQRFAALADSCDARAYCTFHGGQTQRDTMRLMLYTVLRPGPLLQLRQKHQARGGAKHGQKSARGSGRRRSTKRGRLSGLRILLRSVQRSVKSTFRVAHVLGRALRLRSMA